MHSDKTNGLGLSLTLAPKHFDKIEKKLPVS
jgi:hypothetical protein